MIIMFNFWKGFFKPSTLYGIRAKSHIHADYTASSFSRKEGLRWIDERMKEGYSQFKIIEGIGVCPDPY